MGKKKHKDRYDDYDNEGMYNQELLNQIADHLEAYIDAAENLFIFEGKSKEIIEEAIKVIKKAIKYLRAGRPDKVFNEERFEKFYRQWKY